MRPRHRLASLLLFLVAAAALLLIPRGSRGSAAPVRNDAGVLARESSAVALDPAALPRAARSAAGDTGDDGPILSLTSLPVGTRLSQPRLALLDPAFGARQIVLDGAELRLTPGVARTIELVSDSPGWVFVPDRIVLAADAHGRHMVEALPRQVIELTLLGAESLAEARVSLTYEFKNGCCPERRSLPPITVALQNGATLLEAPPIDGGRYRFEVSSPEHHLARSAWLELDPSGWSRVTLAMRPFDGGTARVLARVVDAATGLGLEGVHVALFEEVPEAPLLGMRLDHDGPQPQRAGEYDPDLIDFPVRARTDADGEVELDARAPGLYRLAACRPGHAESLGEPLELAPGTEQTLELRLERGASLAGRVRMLDGDPALAALRGVSGVRLERGGTTYTAAFDRAGGYRFDGLASGRYLLRVEGVALSGDSESLVPLVTQELVLAAGEERELDFALGALAPGRSVVGTLSSGEGDDWSWFVVLLPADASPESLPVQIASASEEGEFALAGVAEGEWIVAAMGRSADGRSLAFARHEFTLAASAPAQVELELRSQGRPLELASTAPASEAREVQLEVGAADPLTRRMLEELPPLSVSAESGARYLGLPEVPLAVRVGTASIPVERGSVVWLP